jgi:sigma-B regulation protein RsbU (phosphoserine phosphatase)
MAEARGVLRSKAQRFGPDLSRLFQSLNNHLVRDVGEARFMTLFYAILDGKSRSLQWNSAGHGPVLWLRSKKGKIGELRTTGIPLGIFQGEDYSPVGPIKLQSGDIVLVGTDGIWEATNSQGEVFGVPRLREILLSSSKKSAREIHSIIMNEVSDFLAGELPEDDITLMVIKTL